MCVVVVLSLLLLCVMLCSYYCWCVVCALSLCSRRCAIDGAVVVAAVGDVDVWVAVASVVVVLVVVVDFACVLYTVY